MEIEANYLAGQIAVGSNAKYLRIHDVQGHAITDLSFESPDPNY